MPLTENSKDYIGRSLLVLPYYGNGWSRPDLGGPPPEPNASIGPEPYHVRVEELITCAGQLTGASGIITEPGHHFEKHWCAFLLRTFDESDFTAHPGHYMIWIARTKLPIHPAPDQALYEWVTFEKSSPCLCGYGMVAETADRMREFYEITMATRKRVLEQPH